MLAVYLLGRFLSIGLRRSHLRNPWLSAVVGLLLFLESGCAVPLQRKAQCEPSDPDMDIVASPVTPQCKQEMARLACQLYKCEKQKSWRSIYEMPPYNPQSVTEIDRVIGDLNLSASDLICERSSCKTITIKAPPGSKAWSDRVSWRQVEGTCESVKRYCFLGLDEGTEFAAMQCQL